jgi:hypothetical protein
MEQLGRLLVGSLAEAASTGTEAGTVAGDAIDKEDMDRGPAPCIRPT